jgi:ABC-type polysaccharide/polyol phosphate transport system ATPase subunit
VNAMAPEIRLDAVSVHFPLYDVNARSLRSDLLRSAGGRITRNDGARVSVRALDGVSLHLTSGDRVGLVGRNGAGKSTLLRVMGGIYHPQEGHVTTRGDVVPMFDLMLGLDLESTGYENTRLRARLLGRRGAEIEALVADVEAFSELGEYMAMPLRTYSSGMLVRLAFAACTGARPDILLIDEMVGAGDAGFFKRAQARLESVVGSAHILVVASHSEYILRKWCTKAILLEQGRVVAAGPTDEILARYGAT